MTLRELIEQYIAFRKSLGELQGSNAGTLRAFGAGLRDAWRRSLVVGCRQSAPTGWPTAAATASPLRRSAARTAPTCSRSVPTARTSSPR